MQKVRNIAIVGAGLVGSMLAIYMAKRGYVVELYERRKDIRKAHAEGGRSINLALSNRGLLPLHQLGLATSVKKLVVPMHGRMVHNVDGQLAFQPYGKPGQAINSISRTGLNSLLMNEAEKAGVKIYFSHRCTEINIDSNLLFFDVDGKQKETRPDIIIGADGAFSVVRGFMQKTDRFNYSQHYLRHGYKELTIPPGAGEALEKHALHIWPRGNYMLIALPNLEGSFTCTLFFPFDGAPSFDQLKTGEEAATFFKESFPDAFKLMPDLSKDFEQNPTSSMVTIKCDPWVKRNTLLIGDASHAIVPFYGQGMNSGFEDCRILNEMLDQYEDDWEKVLLEFNELRKPDTDAIADLAFQNFIEMRDLVADKQFLLRKRIEGKLHELYPDKWIPLYSMVTFDENMRYSEALDIGRKQDAIMKDVMNIPAIQDIWEHLDFQSIVNKIDGD